MSGLRKLQQAFADAVFTGETTALAQTVRANGLTGPRRLQVYRNNMFVSLTEALRAVFPVVEKLVGNEFFAHAARQYIQTQPSTSGDLHDFGGSFAEFLAPFPGADQLAYLPDVARLEWAYHEVFHAADHEPLALESLAAIPAANHEQIKFALHPASRLLQSPYPILRIWEVNQNEFDASDEGKATIDLDAGGVTLLVLRRELDVEFRPLPPAEFEWLRHLATANSIGVATARAVEMDPDFDLDTVLMRHVTGSTLVRAYL